MQCFECGHPADHNHHVVPKSLGGTKTVPLCFRCHSRAHGEDEGVLALAHRAWRHRVDSGKSPNGAFPSYGTRIGAGGVIEENAAEKRVLAIAIHCVRGHGYSQRHAIREANAVGIRDFGRSRRWRQLTRATFQRHLRAEKGLTAASEPGITDPVTAP